MIPHRIYKNKKNRDQNVYLGIDGSDIPFELFKGVYLEHGLVFTDDIMHGVQFVVDKDKECVNLFTGNADCYVTLEDLENDEWISVMRPARRRENPWTIDIGSEFFVELQLRSDLKSYYMTGRQGLLKISEKVYDDEEMYYMKFNCEFITKRIGKYVTLFSEVGRHSRFVHRGLYLGGEMDLYMNTKRKIWDKFIKELKDLQIKNEEENKKTRKMQNSVKDEDGFFSFNTLIFKRNYCFITEEINGEEVITGVSGDGLYGTIRFAEAKTNYFYLTDKLQKD